MQKIVIWGAGGHALVVAEVLRLCAKWNIVGFLDDISPQRRGERFCESTILGGTDMLPDLRAAGVKQLAMAVGDCPARLMMLGRIEDLGFSLPRIIHPRAYVAGTAVLGDGTMIAAGAVVASSASLGRAVIVNTCASVDHESEVGDGAHICPGVHLAGRVKVGRGAFVGIGAVVIDRVRVGHGACIGAGAVVVRDVPPKVLACGVPARIIKKLE
jgi:UDP-N-acetylbacillosamine N-acetyltransferase